VYCLWLSGTQSGSVEVQVLDPATNYTSARHSFVTGLTAASASSSRAFALDSSDNLVALQCPAGGSGSSGSSSCEVAVWTRTSSFTQQLLRTASVAAPGQLGSSYDPTPIDIRLLPPYDDLVLLSSLGPSTTIVSTLQRSANYSTITSPQQPAALGPDESANPLGFLLSSVGSMVGVEYVGDSGADKVFVVVLSPGPSTVQSRLLRLPSWQMSVFNLAAYDVQPVRSIRGEFSSLAAYSSPQHGC
jgi:hypothetical protein